MIAKVAYYVKEFIEQSSCFIARHDSSARKNCNLRSLGLTKVTPSF